MLKICDFGVSRDLSMKMSGLVGSIQYTAPEVLINNENFYNEMCDIYSFAIILWEVLSRKRPYEDIEHYYTIIMGVALNDMRPPLIRNCPQVFETIMTKCWSKDPTERYSMDRLVKIFDNIFKDVCKHCKQSFLKINIYLFK